MEEANKYLYGASVQGIQNFIFQTNKLAEIAGASELVEQICFKAFDEKYVKDEKNWIVHAAGKIIYIFENKEDCKKAVLEFPREVMKMAPGITISQAVVVMNKKNGYEEASQQLKQRLQVQRNKPVRPLTLGLIAIFRAPSTGLPAIKENDEEMLIDEASQKKIDARNYNKKGLVQKTFGEISENDIITYDINKMVDEGINDWIAVIHADGNDLGKVVKEISKNEKDMRLFSSILNGITQFSAQEAFNAVIGKRKEEGEKRNIPICPVVLGGDDLTLICRGDLAMEYTRIFLKTFEAKSKECLQSRKLEFSNSQNKIIQNGLTACVGIVYIKSSYPFHYAVDLADTLCRRAKKAARKKSTDMNLEVIPSCLMFHKVQDSFVQDFEEIAKRVLTPKKTSLTFENGPYYSNKEISENTIERLLKQCGKMETKEGNAVKSHLRQWLRLLYEDVEMANQKMKRIIIMTDKTMVDELFLEDYAKLNSSDEQKIPFYDILSLASLNMRIQK